MKHRHFIIIGGQRCGTTFLARWLSSIQGIVMARPERPEPKFFLQPAETLSYNEYLVRYFPHADECALLGEKSTSYIEHPEIAAHMEKLLPGLRLVAVLRDPVCRALSNYRFSRSNHIETLSFDEAIAREAERIDKYDHDAFSTSPFAYATRGCYAPYLAPFSERFGERFFVLQFEKMIRNKTEMQRLMRFLGLDESTLPSMPRRVNASPEMDVEISSRTRQVLKDRFKDSNRILNRSYGIDLSLWSSHG